MPMRCIECGMAIHTGLVFPGARITCPCGASSLVTVSHAVAAAGPYRTNDQPSFPWAQRPSETRRASSKPRGSKPRTKGLCPRCKAPLLLREDGSSTDVTTPCTSCGGLFVPWESLRSALADAHTQIGDDESTTPSSSMLEKVVYLPCPACAEPMNRTLYSPRSRFIVDVCSRHGIWFDAGELRRAVPHPILRRPILQNDPLSEEIDADAASSTVDARPERSFAERLADLLFDLIEGRR